MKRVVFALISLAAMVVVAGWMWNSQTRFIYHFRKDDLSDTDFEVICAMIDARHEGHLIRGWRNLMRSGSDRKIDRVILKRKIILTDIGGERRHVDAITIKMMHENGDPEFHFFPVDEKGNIVRPEEAVRPTG